jgi:2-dehydro-3-deoxygluconokinase
MASSGAIVCFGEVLLRFSAPQGELLLQTPSLEVAVGGAEANVAVALSRAGAPAAMLSILPDNPLGSAARDALRRYGVDTSGIRFSPGRMGLYFLTPGAVLRAADVFYDRAESAFAAASYDGIDWRCELQGASRLHLSGVTPALGAAAAAAAVQAAQAATQLQVPISFDGNYRPKLWRGRAASAPSVLCALLQESETAFIDHRDIALALGQSMAGDTQQESALLARAFDAFPNLRRIAYTHRMAQAADRHALVGHLVPREGEALRTPSRTLHGIVDRVGAGDAFAAGVLYGLWRGLSERQVLDYGFASACLKHSIKGDAGLATESDLDAFLSGGFDIRR